LQELTGERAANEASRAGHCYDGLITDFVHVNSFQSTTRGDAFIIAILPPGALIGESNCVSIEETIIPLPDRDNIASILLAEILTQLRY